MFLTLSLAAVGAFAYAPNGRTALISNHGDGTISVLDLNENRIVDTLTAGTGIETLSYY